MAKIRISALTTKSQTILAKKMSMDDLEQMVNLRGDVIKGRATIELYRQFEETMVIKYGFSVK